MRKKQTRKQKVVIQEQRRNFMESGIGLKYGIGFLFAGTVFLALFGNMWLNRNAEINTSELTAISGTAKERLSKEWRRKAGQYIDIRLNEYPNAYFRVGRFTAEKT